MQSRGSGGLGINSLGADSFSDAVDETGVLDAAWNAATILIGNTKVAVTLDCVRGMAKEYVETNNLTSAAENCVKTVIVTIISNKLFSNTGKYANLLREQFKKQPSKTIGKLKSYAITQESMLELTNMLFSSAVEESANKAKIIELIKIAYE